MLLVAWFGVDPGLFGVELMTAPGTGLLTTGVEQMDAQSGNLELVQRDPISFQWIGPVALVVNIVVGTLASMLFVRRKPLKPGGR